VCSRGVADMNVYYKNLFEGLKVSCRVADKTKTWDSWGDSNFIGDYCKFYFFLEGTGVITVEGTEYDPKPGQLMLVPCGIKHSYRTVPGNTYYKYWCHFDCVLNDKSLFTFLKVPYIVDVEDKIEVEKEFEELIQNMNKEDLISVLKVKKSILRIIEEFLSNCRYSFEFPLDESEIIMKILKYIDDNIDKKISVKDLSSYVHFHPNHFMRYFKEHVGKPPLKYIKDIRIYKAKNLLYLTSETISEIAEKVGYPDVEYFSKRFKRDTGFSPSDFRKLSRANPTISGL